MSCQKDQVEVENRIHVVYFGVTFMRKSPDSSRFRDDGEIFELFKKNASLLPPDTILTHINKRLHP